MQDVSNKAILEKVDTNTRGIETLSKKVGVNTRKIDVLSKKVDINTQKIDVLSKKVDINTQKTDKISWSLARLTTKVVSLELRFSAIEKSVSLIPKLYNNVDAFMAEILANKQERVAINSRMSRNEKRITKLEGKYARI